MTLAGRVALVTGGNRGIGGAISLALARDGADVAVLYRREEASAHETAAHVQKLGRRCVTVQADVSDYEQVKAAVAKATQALGTVDILVHNAGIASRGLSIVDSDPKEWRRVIDTHIFGGMHLVKEVAPGMRGKKRGDVIFISSAATLRSPPHYSPYLEAKAGLEAMARALAKEERKNNIRVNVVAPGLVETELGRRLVKGALGVDDIKTLYATYPFGRVCQPEDVADFVAFLCSPGCQYVSGQVIYMDGGMGGEVPVKPT
ncbi:MAG: glucose 1-dehydrogenase [Dehalococcoidia bacterium]|nr:glucose 1-dehydrogenase [Dehalococcoidia bacterium]